MFSNYTEADLAAGRKAFGGGGVGSEIPIVVDYGQGARLYDKAGKEYIDCTSQAWSLNIGYSHPKVIQAVEEVLGKYSHIRTSFETVPKPAAIQETGRAGSRRAGPGDIHHHGFRSQRRCLKDRHA